MSFTILDVHYRNKRWINIDPKLLEVMNFAHDVKGDVIGIRRRRQVKRNQTLHSVLKNHKTDESSYRTGDFCTNSVC